MSTAATGSSALADDASGGAVVRARQALAPGQPGRPLALAAGMFAVTWAAIVFVAISLRGHPEADLTGLVDLVTALTALLAVSLGLLDVVQYRMERSASHPWIGVGMILYGALFLYGGQVLPLGEAKPAVLGYVPPAALVLLLLGMALAAAGLLSDRGLRSAATWARMVVGLAALTAGLQLMPSLARALALTAASMPSLRGAALGQWTLALLWVGVSGVFVQIALRRTLRPSHTAVAIAALALAQSRLALAVAPDSSAAYVLGSHVLQLVGFAVALAVVGSDFGHQVSDQQSQLLDSIVLAGADRARREARRTLQSVHAHDVRSALFAVEGAAQTLSSNYDSLEPEDRTALSSMLSSGVGKLRSLVAARIEDIEPFEVGGVAQSVAQAERRAGTEIDVEVQPGLRAVGRVADLVGVLHALVEAVPDSSRTGLTLRATAEGDLARIVIDCPSRIPPAAESVAVFVAARLIQDQDGQLTRTQGLEGRTEFVVQLPLADGAS